MCDGLGALWQLCGDKNLAGKRTRRLVLLLAHRRVPRAGLSSCRLHLINPPTPPEPADSDRSPSFPRSLSIRRRCVRVGVWVIGVYVLTILILVAGEERLAFPGWTIPKPWVGFPPGVVVEEIDIISADGNSIHAWWLPAPEGNTADRALIYIMAIVRTYRRAGRPWQNGARN